MDLKAYKPYGSHLLLMKLPCSLCLYLWLRIHSTRSRLTSQISWEASQLQAEV